MRLVVVQVILFIDVFRFSSAAQKCNGMQGLCTITKKSRCFGEETEETILGIRFTT